MCLPSPQHSHQDLFPILQIYEHRVYHIGNFSRKYCHRHWEMKRLPWLFLALLFPALSSHWSCPSPSSRRLWVPRTLAPVWISHFFSSPPQFFNMKFNPLCGFFLLRFIFHGTICLSGSLYTNRQSACSLSKWEPCTMMHHPLTSKALQTQTILLAKLSPLLLLWVTLTFYGSCLLPVPLGDPLTSKARRISP